MSASASLSESAKLLLLVSYLAKQGTITHNAKAFLKELVLRRDRTLSTILERHQNRRDQHFEFMEELHALIIAESTSAYNELFVDTSLEVGKSLSKTERGEDRKLNDDKNLIYGEVDYKSFYSILRKVQPVAGKTFYDLGSGTGKAVFAARMTQDFERCIGIEILQGLHNQAFKITERFNASFKQVLDASHRQFAAVYQGSFLDFDWSDGDVVFANSTCFSDDLMDKVSRMAEDLKPGAIVVTFTKGLSNTKKFELLEKKREKMSWGPATVYIQRRLKDDGTPFGPSDCLNLLPSDNKEYQESNHGSSDEDDDDDDEEEDEEEEESDYASGDDSDDDSEEEDSDEEDSDEDADDDSNPFAADEWKPRPHPGKLSIQPVYPEAEDSNRNGQSVFGGGSPLRTAAGNYGFNSPQDSALLQRKAAMANRRF